jgi:Meiotically up-regulated gene 113
MRNSMAGVGGQPQFSEINDLGLATCPKTETAHCGVPNVLANRKVDKICFVYFIQSGQGGPIKIGKAVNPTQRIGNIQVGNPHEVKLLHCLPDTGATEGRIHGIFEESHLRGEWFRPTCDLLEFIEALKSKSDAKARQLISRTIKQRQAIRDSKLRSERRAKKAAWKDNRQALRSGEVGQCR